MSFIMVPRICEEGEVAAALGTKLATLAQPMGFTFCPYTPGTSEHYNFISGVVEAHFGSDRVRGDENRWVRP